MMVILYYVFNDAVNSQDAYSAGRRDEERLILKNVERSGRGLPAFIWES
jgi:hypothetical protein